MKMLSAYYILYTNPTYRTPTHINSISEHRANPQHWKSALIVIEYFPLCLYNMTEVIRSADHFSHYHGTTNTALYGIGWNLASSCYWLMARFCIPTKDRHSI